jgi:hypothetical protein
VKTNHKISIDSSNYHSKTWLILLANSTFVDAWNSHHDADAYLRAQRPARDKGRHHHARMSGKKRVGNTDYQK